MQFLTPNYHHILLADDDEDDCFLFKEALDDLGIDIQLDTVHSGDALMKLLNKSEPLPQLLFLDLNMPRKNGLQCLAEIKQTERLKHLPVIIYSTSFQKNVVDLLYHEGAQFYIRKPNEFAELKRAIYEALTTAAQLNYQQPSKEGFVLSHAIE